jgi:hypothetical protein
MSAENPSINSRRLAAEQALKRYWHELEAQARSLGLPDARFAGHLPVDGALLFFAFKTGAKPVMRWQSGRPPQP